MSDQKLRDLERRWKETGTVEDEAAYLLERVRAGDLSRERLELAGLAGSLAAQTAIGVFDLHLASDPSAVAQTLAVWGRAALVSAVAAVALEGARTFEARYPDDHRPRLAAQAALDWSFCPCPRHAGDAREAESTAQASVTRSLHDTEFEIAACARTARIAATLAGADDAMLTASELKDASSALFGAVPALMQEALIRWSLRSVPPD